MYLLFFSQFQFVYYYLLLVPMNRNCTVVMINSRNFLNCKSTKARIRPVSMLYVEYVMMHHLFVSLVVGRSKQKHDNLVRRNQMTEC